MKKTREEYLEELRKIAEDNGGRLLSTEWLGAKTLHHFAFVDGREFEVPPCDFKRNGWPKNEDLMASRFAERQQSVSPAHSDSILSAHKPKPAPAACPTLDLAERVKEFQAARAPYKKAKVS